MSPIMVGLLAVISAGIGGGTVGTVLVKRMSRTVDDATAEKIRAEAKGEAQRTATAEVDTLRQIIAEVRESEARKVGRIDALEKRLEKLEERERHALTRAAVHEAWDQLALGFIIQHRPDFPPPPPLADRAIYGPDDHTH